MAWPQMEAAFDASRRTEPCPALISLNSGKNGRFRVLTSMPRNCRLIDIRIPLQQLRSLPTQCRKWRRVAKHLCLGSCHSTRSGEKCDEGSCSLCMTGFALVEANRVRRDFMRKTCELVPLSSNQDSLNPSHHPQPVIQSAIVAARMVILRGVTRVVKLVIHASGLDGVTCARTATREVTFDSLRGCRCALKL